MRKIPGTNDLQRLVSSPNYFCGNWENTHESSFRLKPVVAGSGDYYFFPSAIPSPIATAPKTGTTLSGVLVADDWGDCSRPAEEID